MASAGKMFKDGSMNVSLKLKTCTLDDLREGIERATSRFVRSEFQVDVRLPLWGVGSSEESMSYVFSHILTIEL